MLPVGKDKDVAAGGVVSVGVCAVYGLFEGLFESVGCVFRECEGCAWPCRVSIGCSAKADVFGIV